jgi:hypothetical protein
MSKSKFTGVGNILVDALREGFEMLEARMDAIDRRVLTDACMHPFVWPRSRQDADLLRNHLPRITVRPDSQGRDAWFWCGLCGSFGEWCEPKGIVEWRRPEGRQPEQTCLRCGAVDPASQEDCPAGQEVAGAGTEPHDISEPRTTPLSPREAEASAWSIHVVDDDSEEEPYFEARYGGDTEWEMRYEHHNDTWSLASSEDPVSIPIDVLELLIAKVRAHQNRSERPHLNEHGEFQSDKYPTCPAGKVPLSTKDPMAQDLLWEYAQRRRPVDKEFSADLETALRTHKFDARTHQMNLIERHNGLLEIERSLTAIWNSVHPYGDSLPEASITSPEALKAIRDAAEWLRIHHEVALARLEGVCDALRMPVTLKTFDRSNDVVNVAKNMHAVWEELETNPPPVPILIVCPACGKRHIDEDEFATKVHHTHSCQHCGNTWRPAVVPTVGVQFLPGFKNEPSATQKSMIENGQGILTPAPISAPIDDGKTVF